MKQTITESDFIDAFRKMGRNGNFSKEGLCWLYDYLEELDPDYDLDVIALCCDYTEATFDEVRENYSIDADEDVLEYLNDKTSVVYSDDDKVMFVQF